MLMSLDSPSLSFFDDLSLADTLTLFPSLRGAVGDDDIEMKQALGASMRSAPAEDKTRAEQQQQLAAALSASSRVSTAASLAENAETAKLEARARQHGLAVCPVARDGHCLAVAVVQNLRSRRRQDVPDKEVFRAKLVAELVGSRIDNYFGPHAETISRAQFRAAASEWGKTGSWKSVVLPDVLRAVPDALGVVILLIRSRPPHELVFPPTSGATGVQTLLILGHETIDDPPRDHFCWLTTTSDAAEKLLRQFVDDLAVQSVAFASVSSQF